MNRIVILMIGLVLASLEMGCGRGTRVIEAPTALRAPGQADFGLVALRRAARSQVVVRNIGPAPVSLLAATIEGAAASEYVLDSLPLAALLNGDAASAGLIFTPRQEGTRQAELLLTTDSPSTPDAAFSLALPELPLSLAPGAWRDLTLAFEPTSVGQANGEIVIQSNDGAAPEIRVKLGAWAIATIPCQVSVTPSHLDFGALPPSQGAVLGFRVVNVGEDLCALKSFAVVGPGAARFRMPDASPVELRPGEWIVRQVSFLGASSSQLQATATFEISNPAHPKVEIPLAAEVGSGCLTAQANFLRSLKGAYQPQRLMALAIAPTETPCPTAGGFSGTRYEELLAASEEGSSTSAPTTTLAPSRASSRPCRARKEASR